MKGTKTRRVGAKFKRKYTKYQTQHCFARFAKQLETLFSYFRIIFNFAKRLKLGETVTCFVQFRISRN